MASGGFRCFSGFRACFFAGRCYINPRDFYRRERPAQHPRGGSATMRPACFFDRDGVIIEEADYIHDPSLVKLCPFAADAIRAMHDAGRLVVIVSNQSGIARGYFTVDDLHKVDARMKELLANEGASVDGAYYCLHHKKGVVPEYTCDCDCRKPKPGLFLQAAKELGIDLAESFMIGDKESDLEAGINAGCRGVALVRTGHGVHQNIEAIPQAVDVHDVLSAAKELLARYPYPGK
ncbi:MAG: HAD family hydrolase [Lentisphaeria bacterium]|nr:HAD family hydrolase [Lentisphaeria bacterium]